MLYQFTIGVCQNWHIMADAASFTLKSDMMGIGLVMVNVLVRLYQWKISKSSVFKSYLA